MSEFVDASVTPGSQSLVSEGLPFADEDRWFIAAFFRGDTGACQLLITAAEQENHLAEAYLGNLYEIGCNCLAKHAGKALEYTERAFPWLQIKVAEGDKYAQSLLGVCYALGRCVAENATEAARLYKLAADQGNANAQHNIGVYLKQLVWKRYLLCINNCVLEPFSFF